MQPRVVAHSPAPPRLRRRLELAVRCCGAVAILTGATALAGWILGNDALKGGLVADITIKANTAACLVLAGVALLLLGRERRGRIETILGRVFAGTLVLVGLATLGEHLFGWDLGIDQMLFREMPGALATATPNRMGPPASSCFPLLGFAFLLLDWRRRGPEGPARIEAPFQIPTLLVMVVALLSLLGYLFQVRELFGIAQLTGIAFHTAFAFLLLGLGALLARPEAGFMRRVVADDPGGLMIRRMLPAAIVLPVLIGWLRTLGEGAGWYHTEFGRSLMVLTFILVFASLTWWTGGAIARQAALLGEARAAMLASERLTQDSLREADRRKDDFLATLAHELRNPLAPIRNAVELLKTRGAPDHESEWSRDVIERQVASLARLLDDLLDVSRITRNRLELRRSPTPIAPIVQHGIETSRPWIEAARHRLTVALPPEDVWIEADPLRIAQVISNLLNNAAKYTEPGGHVRLEARREGSDLVVAVRDDGIGIAPGHISQVFEMFAQAAPALQRSRGGLGIGLSLSRAIVEAHGGSIAATSDGLGRGSEFIFRLPTVRPPQGERASASAPRPLVRAATPLRILVADDNEDALESLAMMLELQGHEVHRAHDGIEAVETFARARPDLALLDIGMPGMNGLAAARSIRGQAGGEAARLVALTGWGQPEDRQRALEAGFDDHLVKPVDFSALAPFLRSATRSFAG